MKLRLAEDLTLPLEAITQTFGILAVRGAGKSNLAAVLAEEMFAAKLPFVVVDPVGAWWGLRSSGDGKAPGLQVPIFGGAHGDVPLEKTGGQLLADLVVADRLSCVLDVADFSEGDKIRFLIDFAERLYRKNVDPLHLFLEEADDYIPQRPFHEQARLLRAFENIVRRGRARGLGITLISQRSAAVNKNVLTQVETLCVLRTTSPQDRKAIAAWIEYHGQAEELLETLPGLQAGEAWIWSPSWLQTLKRIQVRRRWTFDSGATPKDVRGARPPATLADVDLGAITKKMAATIERAKAEDPRELRRRIAELERERKTLVQPTLAAPAKIERIEVPVLRGPELAKITKVAEKLAATGDVLVSIATQLEQEHRAIVSAIARAADGPPRPILSDIKKSTPRALGPSQPASRQAVRPARQQASAAVDSGEPLSSAQQRILDAGVFLESLGISSPSVVQLALFAGQSAGGGYWRRNVGRLRTLGLVDGVQLTEAGRSRAEPSAIATVAELHEHVFTNLLEGAQRQILRVLIDAYPDALTPEECGARAQLEPEGGYWRRCLGRLRSLGLVTKRGPLAALPVLFLP